MSAATLGEALDLVARFLPTRSPSLRGEGESEGAEYRFVLGERVALLAEERPFRWSNPPSSASRP